METEVETIIAQLCGCIDTGTLSKYGKNSRVEDVENKRKKCNKVTCVPGTYKTPLTDEEQLNNAKYIYEYLSNEGWTKEAICAFLGNVYEESGLNPAVWENMNNEQKGYGIVQFTKYKDNYKFIQWFNDYVVDNGLNEYSEWGHVGLNKFAIDNPEEMLKLQLEYFVISCKIGGEWIKTSKYHCPVEVQKISYDEFINSNMDPEKLAYAFHGSYERSGDTADMIQERADSARYWYEEVFADYN